ncbi:MAG: hypothetical protein ACJZ2G_06615 [Thalassobaculaceae bacterium]
MQIRQSDLSILIACFTMATIAWGTVFYGHSVYLDAFTRLGPWTTQQITSAILIFLALKPARNSIYWLFNRQ